MNKKTIGEKIRIAREKKQITQAELAEKMHISASSLCRWEKGAYEPSIEFIEEICHVLDITVEELLGLPEKSNLPPKKRLKIKWPVAVVSLIVLAVILFLTIIPKFRIVDSDAYNVDRQGLTAVVKVVPILWFNERQALNYCNILKKEYSNKEFDAIEVWFAPSEYLTEDYDDALAIYTYMLKES